MKAVVVSSLILCGLITVGAASSTQASQCSNKQVQFSINIQSPDYYPCEEDDSDFSNDSAWINENAGYRHGRLHWVTTQYGNPVPYKAVAGGFQPCPPATLYVCRAFYNGGMHPGKLYQGHCNIGWGGREIVLDHYQVLTSYSSLHWVRTGYGDIPPGAVQGGYQHDGPLYICRTKYQGGLHIGKVIKENCNIGWGGREITIPIYDVLTR